MLEIRASHVLVALCSALVAWTTPAVAQDERIEALIQRVEQQERELKALREELQQLREHGAPPPEHPEYRKEDGEELLTDYENPRIRLDVSGQINQAVNFVDDGESGDVFFVDNDTSGSRLRFAGVATYPEGPELGTVLEIAFSGNNSFDVSQDSESPGDFLQVRRADVWVMDERYGRLMFGRGNQAADNTAEYDLSLVGAPIMMSGIAFPFGGMQFTDGENLSGTTVGGAFFNFDGFRANRIRYDTPMFGSAQFSVSAGADGRLDAALTFGGDYDHWTGVSTGAFTQLAAISIHDPTEAGVEYRMAGSWSLLHNESGLSLTLSGGFDETEDGGGTPYNSYVKLGWDTQILPWGQTGFGLDYTRTENVSGEGDEGQSVGLAAVQVLDRYGLELYTQLRWLELENALGASFKDMWIFTSGTRVRF